MIPLKLQSVSPCFIWSFKHCQTGSLRGFYHLSIPSINNRTKISALYFPSAQSTMMATLLFIFITYLSFFIYFADCNIIMETNLIGCQNYHSFLGFLRSPSYAQSDYMSVPDVAAAVSVLLGFAPSQTISAPSASKLNDILSPSPFSRPRAVFLLEVTAGAVAEHLSHSRFSDSLNRKISFVENSAIIQLPGGNEASFISLDEPLSNVLWTDKHIADFALWIGGSYVSDTVEPLNGELNYPLDNGAELKLHMSQVADREFSISLLTLVHNVQKAIKLHLEATNNGQSPAELLMGSFDCLKGLKEKHSTEGVSHQRMELFVSTFSKIFDLLLDAYRGQIVGVFLLKEKPSAESVSLFDVTSSSQYSRWLAEKEDASDPISIARVLLVRRTLAWITGIILLIASLLGVYFLMNMPLTRDTLLYSNVKLD